MEKFDKDFARLGTSKGWARIRSVVLHRQLFALWLFRKTEGKENRFAQYMRNMGGSILKKYGIEIGKTDNIGGGLLMIHAYNITINHRGSVGEYLTIFKGATIGSIRSGKKKGVPKIGNRVTIGANAMVCGNITIGDDVLIAANAYVNFDVPSNSVVIGNPGVIHHKDSPSADYLKL